MTFSFVNPENMKTVEHQIAALVCGIHSLMTLRNFQIAAYKLGLFEEEEEELSKTICWEIDRLLLLYKRQLSDMLDRTPYTEKDVIDALQTLVEKKPKRKRNGKI